MSYLSPPADSEEYYVGMQPPPLIPAPSPTLPSAQFAPSPPQHRADLYSPASHHPSSSSPSAHSISSSYTYSTPSLSNGTMSTSSSQDCFPSPLPQYPTPPTQSGPYFHSINPSKQGGGSGGGGGKVFINPPGHGGHHGAHHPHPYAHASHAHHASPRSERGGTPLAACPPPLPPVGEPRQASLGGGSKGKAREWEMGSPGVMGDMIAMAATPTEWEAATRRGEDLGIGLGDFDMLDTLGTGTFGKVLLARLRLSSARPAQTQPHYFAMKVLEKTTVVRLRQVEHLNSERSTLAQVSHPFIVNLFCTFQDERNLYLLLEYVQGGELFSHLRRAGRFSSDVARFFAANLILALEYLHSQDIIYRDLKPENLLIDATGYLKITDFGFAKHVTDRTYTLCGTPEYLAPEIITAIGHGKAADFWAFGVLLFELLAGYPPFFADSPLEIYEKILTGKFVFPPHVDFVAKDLIRRLLTADLSKRLGNLKDGAADIKNHRWFEGVDWDMVERKEIRAPVIPQTSTPGDTSNFENYPSSPLESLPGVLRAHRARQMRLPEDSYERGPDPYLYLFPSF